mgnify:CR=1 FL=1
MSAQRPSWTLSEAVERTEASRSTLKRLIASNAFPGAYKDTRGRWLIPLNDLIAAGYPPVSSIEGLAPTAEETTQAGDAGEIEALRAELRVMRAERDAARAIAEAHEHRADAAERALRLLEAPKRTWSTDLGQPVQNGPGGPVQNEKDQVKTGPSEPVQWTTEPDHLDQREPERPRPAKSFWQRLIGH